jgi:hypothetical protein
LVPNKNPRFAAILAKIEGKRSVSPYTSVYADASTADFILRVALIPQDLEFKFFELDVDFDRTAPPDTSRGFCAHITSKLPPTFRIWKLTNFTRESEVWFENGGAKILIEDTEDEQYTSEKIETVIDKIQRSPYRSGEGQQFDIRPFARRLSSQDLWKTLVGERVEDPRRNYKFDVFLSYASKEEEIARQLEAKLKNANLRCFMATKELRSDGGADFSELIRDSIINSMEMAILCSPYSIKSTWVTTEWGAAWALKIRITPILYQLSVVDLPERLRRLQYVDCHAFDEYIDGILKRREKSGRRPIHRNGS